MWMSTWGLIRNLPARRFLGGRGMRVLPSGACDAAALPVPEPVRRQAYNPSVLALPAPVRRNLRCDECAFAASVRVDWMTQCEGFTELLARRRRGAAKTPFGARKRTLFMLLDASWGLLHWGWIRRPPPRPALVALRANGTLGGLFSRKALAAGVELVDVRLLIVRDRLYTLGTYPARAYASAVAPLRVRRRAGLRELLAWQLPGEMLHLRRGVCSGRSQAFFEHGDASGAAGGGARLLFQSWLVPSVVCEVRYAMLCYAMLCYAMLCCAMLCYAMLCFEVRAPEQRLPGASRHEPRQPAPHHGPLVGQTAAPAYESAGLEAAA
jgi:hypothetical protein